MGRGPGTGGRGGGGLYGLLGAHMHMMTHIYIRPRGIELNTLERMPHFLTNNITRKVDGISMCKLSLA